MVNKMTSANIKDEVKSKQPIPRWVTRSSLLFSWSSVQTDITLHSEALVPTETNSAPPTEAHPALPGVTDTTNKQHKLVVSQTDNDVAQVASTLSSSNNGTMQQTSNHNAYNNNQIAFTENDVNMDTDIVQMNTDTSDIANMTLPVVTETLSVITETSHGVTGQSKSGSENDSGHKSSSENKILSVVTSLLPGIMNNNTTDHAYHRQDDYTDRPTFHAYATTEDEDNAIDALLQLSKSQVADENILSDNSELLPIGANLPDLAPTRIALDTDEVVAAMENITFEETVAKTSVTIGTQTSFTRTK